ncbi:MAG: glutamine--fructose-6-phosphate transaminase (isomerizing), partial [Thermodesulfobacteriota bacterium]
MCGIIGYIGKQDCLPILTAGLKRLEYRGYDSAGLALMANGQLVIRRSSGKLSRLARRLKGLPSRATLGIGHTRWATHGRPSEANAHPHRAGPVAIVHNGIVENYLQLKQQILSQGHTLSSDTDTEIIAHLINQQISQGVDLVSAVRNALTQVEGYYALAIVSETEPDKLIAARMGSPLVVGLGKEEYFIASDVLAILNHTNKMIFLDDGELALLSRNELRFMDLDGQTRKKEVHEVPLNPALAEKGRYKHFMQKEIYEQPWAITNTLRGRISVEAGEVRLSEIKITKKRARGLGKVFLVACGTSYHAALVGKFMLERLARIPTEVDIGSEFRYR